MMTTKKVTVQFARRQLAKASKLAGRGAKRVTLEAIRLRATTAQHALALALLAIEKYEEEQRQEQRRRALHRKVKKTYKALAGDGPKDEPKAADVWWAGIPASTTSGTNINVLTVPLTGKPKRRTKP